MKLRKIIGWEFKNAIGSKQYIITTVLIMVIMAIAILAITIAEGRSGQPIGPPPPPFIIGIILSFILFLSAFMTGVFVMYAVIKEKQSRVVELMLSTVSAWELMAGKIIGLGFAGLVQMLIWSTVAYIAVNQFGSFPLTALSLVHWLSYPLYFVFGYLLIASMFATVGAAIKDIHSGGAVGLIGMIPYLPMTMIAAIIENPNMPWLRIAQYFPPFTPGIMLMRIGAVPIASNGAAFVPAWEIASTLATLALGAILMMRFASKVFHTGMLMYGKSASFRELWKWGRKRVV